MVSEAEFRLGCDVQIQLGISSAARVLIPRDPSLVVGIDLFMVGYSTIMAE